MPSFASFMTFVVGAISGAFIELVIVVIFEHPFRGWYKRLRRNWLWILSRFHVSGYEHNGERLQIGNWRTNSIVLEGTGVQTYKPENIICHLDPTHIQLPTDLQAIKEKVETQQNKLKNQYGVPTFYNGPMVAFIDYNFSRTTFQEDPILSLRFKLTDYYSFLATSLSLNEMVSDDNSSSITVREKHLRRTDFRRPLPYLATSFGINMTLVTKDGYFVLAKRGQRGVSSYQGMFTVPILESVNPYLDLNDRKQIDLFTTAKRGAHEELGIEVEIDEIKFFALQVDTLWYMYGMTGAIFTEHFTRDDVIARRSTGTKDKWEADDLRYIKFNPQSVSQAMKEMGGDSQINPSAFASIIHTLISEFGTIEVEKAFTKTGPL